MAYSVVFVFFYGCVSASFKGIFLFLICRDRRAVCELSVLVFLLFFLGGLLVLLVSCSIFSLLKRFPLLMVNKEIYGQ